MQKFISQAAGQVRDGFNFVMGRCLDGIITLVLILLTSRARKDLFAEDRTYVKGVSR